MAVAADYNDWKPAVNREGNSQRLTGHERCAELKVQWIGEIQPHGLLFALSEADMVVRHVSSNVFDFLGIIPEAILGGSIEKVLGAAQFEELRRRVRSDEPLGTMPLHLAAADDSLHFQCIAYRQDGMAILEMEPAEGTHSLLPLDIDTHIRTPLRRIEAASGILEVSQLAAVEVQKLSGFDRVMVYRFDKEWNGEVIAEATAGSNGSYLGLRFPASDIPPPVRQLFLLNRLRMIADVEASPVSLVSAVTTPTQRPLDLTRSVLRSSAPIHLEYLRNMEVRSSLTISILVDGRLWGMIACHHSGPRRLDRSARSLCELIGETLAFQVNLRIENEALQARLESRRLIAKCMTAMEESESLLIAGQFEGSPVLELLDADGILARIDGVPSSCGVVVEEEQLVPVLERLRSLSTDGIASSSKLGDLDPGSSYAAHASGGLYIGLSEDCGDYLLLLRRELVETVVWAGNPNTAVTTDELGQLHPRSSFAAWQETVRGRSRPWSELELERASILRQQLLRLQSARKLCESQALVQYLAHHDTLTGLLNRHSIRLKLDEFIQHAEGSQTTFAVLFIDLDRFKHFNDTLGHAAGDTILKVVGKRMQQQVRDEDVVGRLGGDEFVIVLKKVRPDTDLTQLFQRILRSISDPIELEDKSEVSITASIGISRYPVDGVTSDALLDQSDSVMYGVKRSGGNAYDTAAGDSVAANGADVWPKEVSLRR